MTPERKTKRFSQSIPLQGAYCSKSTQSHQVQQDTHLHALSKGTLRFPHLELTLFYYRQSRVATICNLSTSVKYLYNCHSIAKSWGKKIFSLSTAQIIPGRCAQQGTIYLPWQYFFVPNTMNDIALLRSEKNPGAGTREAWWKTHARMPKCKVGSLG